MACVSYFCVLAIGAKQDTDTRDGKRRHAKVEGAVTRGLAWRLHQRPCCPIIINNILKRLHLLQKMPVVSDTCLVPTPRYHRLPCLIAFVMHNIRLRNVNILCFVANSAHQYCACPAPRICLHGIPHDSSCCGVFARTMHYPPCDVARCVQKHYMRKRFACISTHGSCFVLFLF